MTFEGLLNLSDAALFRYFCKNAQYDRKAQLGYQYRIRLGTSCIFSDDTKDLLDKFKNKVAFLRKSVKTT